MPRRYRKRGRAMRRRSFKKRRYRRKGKRPSRLARRNAKRIRKVAAVQNRDKVKIQYLEPDPVTDTTGAGVLKRYNFVDLMPGYQEWNDTAATQYGYWNDGGHLARFQHLPGNGRDQLIYLTPQLDNVVPTGFSDQDAPIRKTSSVTWKQTLLKLRFKVDQDVNTSDFWDNQKIKLVLFQVRSKGPIANPDCANYALNTKLFWEGNRLLVNDVPVMSDLLEDFSEMKKQAVTIVAGEFPEAITSMRKPHTLKDPYVRVVSERTLSFSSCKFIGRNGSQDYVLKFTPNKKVSYLDEEHAFNWPSGVDTYGFRSQPLNNHYFLGILYSKPQVQSTGLVQINSIQTRCMYMRHIFKQ